MNDDANNNKFLYRFKGTCQKQKFSVSTNSYSVILSESNINEIGKIQRSLSDDVLIGFKEQDGIPGVI